MSMSASGYAPGDVDRESYEAGWQAASAIEGVRLARRERRGDILVSFISGGLLLGVGILALVLSATSGGRFVVVSFGAIFTGGGLIVRGFAIASGKDVSDAADGGA